MNTLNAEKLKIVTWADIPDNLIKYKRGIIKLNVMNKTRWHNVLDEKKTTIFSEMFTDTFRYYTEKVLSFKFVVDYKDLPDSPGIYFVSSIYNGDLISATEIISYVGISEISMRQRWKHEHKCKNYQICKIYYLEVGEGEFPHLEAIENHFIGILMPELNERGMGAINTNNYPCKTKRVITECGLVINPVFSGNKRKSISTLCMCGTIGDGCNDEISAHNKSYRNGWKIMTFRVPFLSNFDIVSDVCVWWCPKCQNRYDNRINLPILIDMLYEAVTNTNDDFLAHVSRIDRKSVVAVYNVFAKNNLLPQKTAL